MLPSSLSLSLINFLFCSGMVTHESSNGDCFCLSRSVDWPEEGDGRAHYIRAEVESSGYLIQPASAVESLVTYINQINLKGALPQRVLKKVMKRRAGNLRGLRAYMNALAK